MACVRWERLVSPGNRRFPERQSNGLAQNDLWPFLMTSQFKTTGPELTKLCEVTQHLQAFRGTNNISKPFLVKNKIIMGPVYLNPSMMPICSSSQL